MYQITLTAFQFVVNHCDTPALFELLYLARIKQSIHLSFASLIVAHRWAGGAGGLLDYTGRSLMRQQHAVNSSQQREHGV